MDPTNLPPLDELQQAIKVPALREIKASPPLVMRKNLGQPNCRQTSFPHNRGQTTDARKQLIEGLLIGAGGLASMSSPFVILSKVALPVDGGQNISS